MRYTQWHTTALCSPTRSCLLTGRNHTRNSMACITEAAIGFPNASGTIPPENGMLPEILGELGWNTYMVGKWHLCPTDEMNLASTRRNWPTRPRLRALVRVPRRRDEPVVSRTSSTTTTRSTSRSSPEEGYHLTDDITDKALEFIKDAKAIAPEKPFFLYYAPGRLPRSAPRAEGVDRQVQGPVRHGLRGDARADARAAEGAGHRPGRHRAAADQPDRHARDAHRARTASRSRRWTSPGRGTRCPTTRSACSARMAEVYAGFLAHADHHIGRLLDYLEETGQLENTMVIVVSDNGASGEGGPNGSVNEMKFVNGIPDDIAENLAMLDELGGTEDLQPLPERLGDGVQHAVQDVEALRVQRRHRRPVHHLVAGRASKARGEIRDQYHHAIDLVPTILDVLGVEAPETIKGHTQSHFDGVSMRYSFDDAVGAVDRARRSSTRCSARAAIWHDGWKAVTTHPTISGWGHFNDDEWELYHTDVDRSELHNLAAEQPGQGCGSWSTSGSPRPAPTRRSRSTTARALEILITPRPQLAAPRDRYVYYPGTRRGARVRRRSTSATARSRSARSSTSRRRARRACCSRRGRASAATPSTSRTTGCTTSTTSSACVEQKIVGDRGRPDRREPDPLGLVREGRRGPAGVATGILSLYHGDTKVGEGRDQDPARRVHRSPARACASAATAASRSPTTTRASRRTRFTGGTINRVAVDVSGEPYVDLEREAAAMMSRE